MNRACALVLAALIGVAGTAHAQVVIGPRAANIGVSPGAQVTVPVVVDLTGGGGVSLGSLAARLSWRPGTLRFDGAVPGTFGSPTVNADSATGTLRFAAANPAGATGEAVVLLASFTGIGTAGDTTSLVLTVDEMTAAGTFGAITPVATSALVCVGSASGRWGDLDGNDSLTSFDALLIVTNAVGLSIAPYSPAAGDVDGDGDADTRDALIVLSHVVGLPTPGFRPGQSIGGACAGNPPATIVAAPVSLALVVGDTLALTATARDSVGQVVSVPGMVWTALNPAVATVTPSGRIAATGAGATGAVVVAGPGVMDTVDVTVTATRSVWYVDVAAAAQQQQENGSPSYPFATLQQAVDRAVAGDTVVVRGGTYPAGAVSDKALTILGDPGFPRPRFGGPLVFDGIAADTVRMVRLVIADAAEGIRAHGLGGGVVLLDSVAVERVRGHGIEVAVFDSLGLRDVAVSGAVEKGILTDSIGQLAFERVNVDAITGASGTGTGWTVLAKRAQSLMVDSGTFRLGRMELDSVLDVRVRQVLVAESYGGLFNAVGAQTVVLDTATFRMGGELGYGSYAVSLDLVPGGTVDGHGVRIAEISGQGLLVSRAATVDLADLTVDAGGQSGADVAAAFPDVGRLTLRRGAIRNGRLWHADALYGGAQVLRLDSVDFHSAALAVGYLDTVVIRVAWFDGVPPSGGNLMSLDSVRVASLVGIEARNGEPGNPAIYVYLADSLRADSLFVHDNGGSGMYVGGARTASMVGSRFERNSLAATYYAGLTLYAQAVRIAQSVFEEASPNSSSLEWYGYVAAGQSLVLDTVQFRGSGTAVTAYANWPTRVTVRGSSLERGPGAYGRRLIYFSVPGRVQILDSRVDSTDYGSYAISGYTDTLEVLSTQMRYVGSGLWVNTWSGPRLPVTVTNSVIDCRPGTGGSYYGMQITSDSATVTGNSVSRCWTGISLYSSTTGSRAEIRGNSVTDLDAINGNRGIYLEGAFSRPVIALNTVARGHMPGAGINVFAYGGIDSARIDSNTVQDGIGRGIHQNGDVRGASIRGNVIERMHPYYGYSEGAIQVESGSSSDTVQVRGNTVRQNAVPGMYLATLSPIRLDSNVVVDDSVFGLWVENNPTTVVGRRNYLARNANGLRANGNITIDSSVIQQSAGVGVQYVGGTVTLMDNYWGDPSGPRCDTGCVGASGDSLAGAGSLNYVPYLTTPPPGTPTGTPPALRTGAALQRPAALVRPRAVAPAWFEERRRALRREGDR